MRSILLTVFLFMMMASSAQQEGRMETDRPDQTESPFITKYKNFQIEIGFAAAHDDDLETIILPTILWKYGVSKKFELRLITEFNVVETPLLIPQGNDFTGGLLPVQIGGKLSLLEEKGLIPKTSVIFHLGIPKVASKKFQSSKWAPSFVFTMQNSLSKSVGLGYNFGAEWDGESDQPYLIYTLSPGFNLGKRWYSFIELFGAVQSKGVAQNNLDGGFGYYINDNIKLDVSAGFGITKASVDHFFGVGLSFRFR